MTAPSQSSRQVLPAPEPAVGLGEAKLTDRERLAILLQGAALLAHRSRSGGGLAEGWAEATLGPEHRLSVPVTPTDGEAVLPQRRASELLMTLFRAEAAIAGRGEARRIARGLLELWSQDLEPVTGDRLVAQILAAAPFLWQPPYAAARSSLAAEIDSRLTVAGPERVRRLLLERCEDLAALQRLLASSDIESLWCRHQQQIDPVGLAGAGHWRRAVAAWEETPPATPAERLEMARALYALGRFEDAKNTLAGMRREPARVVRLACQLRLGELRAVKRSLTGWSRRPPRGEALIDLAAIAVRLYANLGVPDEADVWLERARRSRDPRVRARGLLLAAEADWDRGDLERMERRLDEADSLAPDPDTRWRREHVRGLLAMARGDGAEVVRHVGEALKDRRRQRPVEAVGLWNDLAVGRALVGDLAGAERALLHVVRLTGDGSGDRRTTLALCNLAEVRLRRGRLRGVAEAIDRSTRTNEAAGNWRGWSQDRALAARLALVEGRPATALETVDTALARLDEKQCEWGAGLLRVLKARALGWLGDAAGAAAVLDRTSAENRAELEPEERAPLWALAGDRDRALEENVEGPCRVLWQTLLAGGAEATWSVLESIEPYRAARLVLDAELLASGSVPKHWLDRAAATLRQVGATQQAARLGDRDDGQWLALERYLRASEPSVDRVRSLMSQLSPEARLTARDDRREDEIVVGVGGEQVVEEEFGPGVLRLSAPQVGPAERVAFALALRDLAPNLGAADRAGRADRTDREPRRGLIGQSRTLTEALDRLGKLARRDIPILIEGETGTGKELAARRVHRLSTRSAHPLLPINCAELSESLLLSELFGHVRGAFTGADRDRAGIFEAARAGTVFLDEIGDLPLAAQGKLLRVLQEGEVRRVGESVPRSVDVRIVAATHRGLRDMVTEGLFREDLYYRLNVGRVEIPPLRDRGSDLYLLTEHFLAREGQGRAPKLTQAAQSALASHGWPGNVRELKNVLAVAFALAEGGPIRGDHLDLPTRSRAPEAGYHEQVEALRRRLVREALIATQGNRAEAARRLGLSRQSLSYLVRSLDIE